MPIRGGSPPAPARSRDDSEDEDEDESHSHSASKATKKDNSGNRSSDPSGGAAAAAAIPPMVGSGWAPAIFVPATFDYTQPQPEPEDPHQRLNQLLTDLDAHAAAVRSNHAWMVGREARRIQQATVQDEAQILASGQPLPRSKRLPPKPVEEAALLRSMAMVPAELQNNRHYSNPNTIALRRTSTYDRNNNVGGTAAAAAADPTVTASPYEVPKNFSYREVSALLVDKRDTPREAAVTSVLNVARNGMYTADWYSGVYQRRRNEKIKGYVGDLARSFAQDMGPKNTVVNSTSPAAAVTPATTATSSGGLAKRARFGGLDGAADDPGDDCDSGMPMDLDN